MAAEKTLQEYIAEAVAAGEVQLPVFNPVAMKLQKMIHSEEANIAEIETMIVEDQSLASRILRIANSAFYQGLHQVTTIRKAIVRLGVQKVASLAMIASQQHAYRADERLFGDYMTKLWQHAFVSATGSQWLADKCGYRSEVETIFIAGLLHNIGQLVILKILEQLSVEGLAGLSDNLILEVLDSSLHTEQGYLLMNRWNLPLAYCQIARDHHKGLDNTTNIPLVIIRLMDQVCEKNGVGLHSNPQIVLVSTPEAQLLALSELRLAELEIVVEDSLEQLKTFV